MSTDGEVSKYAVSLSTWIPEYGPNQDLYYHTRNDAESGDKSDNKSIMMSKQDMENINSGDESDHDLICT